MALIVFQCPRLPPFTYAPPRVRVGRGAQTEVTFDDPRVSRLHCVLEVEAGELWISDHGSAGGIFVAGQRRARGPLLPGEEVSLGSASFRAWLEEREEPDASALEEARGTRDEGRLRALAERGGGWLRAAASNPCAPADLLALWSQAPDPATLRALTANPGAPAGVLLRLGRRFPGEFWSNPLVDFLLLEDPELRELSSYALCSLLASGNPSPAHLRHFLTHPSEAVREFARNALRGQGEQ